MLKLKWILLAVILGILVIIGLKQLTKVEVSSENVEVEHPVYATKITIKDIAPLIQGFGVTKAKVQWKALSEVKGSLVYKYHKLSLGEFIKKDTLLLKIDATPYELALATAIANQASIKTEFQKLAIEKDKFTLSLKLEKRNLNLDKKEYNRQRSLSKSGTISKSQLEKQQRTYTIQQLKVKDISAQLEQIPARLNAIKASNAQAQSQIQQAELDLAHTSISMPFDGRIEQVNIELGEYTGIGQTLLTAQDYSLMEVEAKVPVHQMKRLSSTISKATILSTNEIPQLKKLKLPVQVDFKSAINNATWQGTLSSISGQVDLRVGTIGVLVEIPFDFKTYIDKKNNTFPLISGMFVEVKINGLKAPHFVIPKKALHGDRLYLVDKNSRLKIQPVDILFTRDNWVAIAPNNIKEGDIVITTDILPATTGLKLKISELEQPTSTQGE